MRFNESLYRLGSLDPWIWMTGNSKHQSKLAYMTPCLKNREAFSSETHHAFTCEHIRDDRHSFSWYYSCYQPNLDSNLSGSLRGRLRTVGVVTARSQSTEYCHNGRSKEQCPFRNSAPYIFKFGNTSTCVLECLDRKEYDLPFERPKHGCSLQSSALTPVAVIRRRKQNTKRNKPCKPENHGHDFHSWDDKTMCQLGKENWGQRKIGRRNKGSPDAIENHEIDSVTPADYTDSC